MQQLASIERSLAKVFEGFPHLPKNVREWIADNVWWIVIIGVALSAMSLMWLLFATVLFGPFLVGYAAVVAGLQQGATTAFVWAISLAAGVVTLVLDAMAIQPLKAKLKRGWNLIFLSALISFVAGVVSAVLNVSFSGLLGSVLGTGIAMYLLFELRSYFAGAAKPVAAAPPKPPVSS